MMAGLCKTMISFFGDAIMGGSVFRRGMLLLGLLLAGCSSGTASDAPDLIKVSGTVLSSGTPVSGATVVFTPQSGGGPSSAVTNPEGVFELIYGDGRIGAVPAQHHVKIIEAFNPGESGGGDAAPGGAPLAPPRETVQEVVVDQNSRSFDFTF